MCPLIFNSTSRSRWQVCGLFVVVSLVFAFILPKATAESPTDFKRVAVETVERNAEQIATVGDVLYYFGESGMQEYESSNI